MLKNVAGQRVSFSLFKSGARIAAPTIAVGDWKVDLSGAGQANVATPPTSDAAGLVTWLPSQAETNADYVTILGNDAAGAEWEPLTVVFETQMPTSVEAILLDTAEIGAAGAGLTALGDARLANLDATVSSRATPADVSVSLAVSATTAAAVASGSMALTLWGSFDQTVTSTSTAALGTADELIWAIKEHKATDADAEALILVREGVGLERLAGAALVLPVVAADGSLTLGGIAGAWTLRCQLVSSIPGALEAWSNRNLDAEIKAVIGDVTINLWEGVARISYQTVREV